TVPECRSSSGAAGEPSAGLETPVVRLNVQPTRLPLNFTMPGVGSMSPKPLSIFVIQVEPLLAESRIINAALAELGTARRMAAPVHSSAFKICFIGVELGCVFGKGSIAIGQPKNRA